MEGEEEINKIIKEDKVVLKYLKRITLGLWEVFWGYRKSTLTEFRAGGLRRAYGFVMAKLLSRGEYTGLGLGDPIAYLFPNLYKKPYMFEIEMTTKCSLGCPVCERTYYTDKQKSYEMSFTEYLELVEKLPNFYYWCFTGIGSPFLCRDWKKIMTDLKRRNVYIATIEHLNTATEADMEFLVDINCNRIGISLDTINPVKYKKIRPNGDLSKVLHNLNYLMEYRKKQNKQFPEIVFKCVLQKDNIRDMFKLINFIWGLKEYRTSPNDLSLETIGILEFPQNTEFNVGVKDDVPAIVYYAKGKIKLFASHPAAEKRPFRQCVSWQEPYVISGRYIIPCCAVLENGKRTKVENCAIGDLTKNTFMEIWNSPRYYNLRNAPKNDMCPVDRICSGCLVFDTEKRELGRGNI